MNARSYDAETGDTFLSMDDALSLIHVCAGANLKASMGYDADAYVLLIERPDKTGVEMCHGLWEVGQVIARFIREKGA